MIQGELKVLQEQIVERRVSRVSQLSKHIFSKKELEVIEQLSEEDIVAEVQYQSCLEAKVMLETLYDRLAEDEHEDEISEATVKAREFLTNIFMDAQEKLAEAEEGCNGGCDVRDFIGELYRKVTTHAANRFSESESTSDLNETRDSKFIEEYLAAFRKNFTFI